MDTGYVLNKKYFAETDLSDLFEEMRKWSLEQEDHLISSIDIHYDREEGFWEGKIFMYS